MSLLFRTSRPARSGSRGTVLVRVLAVVAAFVALGACHAKSHRVLEQAPYTTTREGYLRVRPDLARMLRVVAVESSTESARVDGFGHLDFAPNASYSVRVPFDGLVDRVHVSLGDTVTAGQPLATLRSADIAAMRAELRGLAATAEAGHDEEERLVRLVEQGAASSRELVASRARLAEIEARIAGIREALRAGQAGVSGDDTIVLHATSAGEILRRNIEPGERIHPADEEPAFVIGDPMRLVVRAQFPERDSTLVKEGEVCRITVPALGQEVLQGRVAPLARAVDATTHTIDVVCLLDHTDDRLRAEMAARVQISTTGASRPVLPRSAMVLRRDDTVVLVERAPGLLERRVVHVGSAHGDDVTVLDGLQNGERIVVERAVLLDGELDQAL